MQKKENTISLLRNSYTVGYKEKSQIRSSMGDFSKNKQKDIQNSIISSLLYNNAYWRILHLVQPVLLHSII